MSQVRFYKLLTACLVALALSVASVRLVVAQEEAETAEASEVSGTPSAVPASPHDRRDLQLRWRALRQARDGSREESRAFEALNEARVEMGIGSLTHHAQALLIEASAAAEADEEERAATLVAWAEALAPDSPTPALYRASLIWSRTPWSLWELSSELMAGHALALASPAQRAGFRLHVRTVALWSLVALALAFVTTQVWRYLKLAVYDLASAVSHIVSQRATALLVALTILLPAALLASPAILVLVALCYVVPYQRRAERIVTALLLVAIGLLPNLVGQIASLTGAVSSSAELYYRAQTELCDPRCQERLDRRIAQDPTDEYAWYTKALLHTRVGSPQDLEAAREILGERDFSEHSRPSVDLLLATVMGLRGERQEASRRLNALLSSQSLSDWVGTAAHFNQYRLLNDLGRRSEAEEHVAGARSLDHAAVIAFMEGAVRTTNRWFMIPGSSPDELEALARREGERRRETTSSALWPPLAGALSPTATRALTAFVALLVLLALSGRVWTRTSESCPKCGGVMSHKERPIEARAGYCGDCYALFMEGAALEQFRRRELEYKVDAHAEWRRRFTVYGNVALSGFGFLLRGATVGGAPLLALAVIGIVSLMCSAPTASPLGVAGEPVYARHLIAGVMLALAYGASWTATWRRRRTL